MEFASWYASNLNPQLTTRTMLRSLVLLICLVSLSGAFVAPLNYRSHSGVSSLHAVDPMLALESLDAELGLELGAVLFAGVATGILSQRPQIISLQEEIAQLKGQLQESQSEFEQQLEELEDKLFQMDQEYEDQTATFKRQYDRTQSKQLEELKQQLKDTYDYQLKQQAKAQELQAQASMESQRTDKQSELSQLKLQFSQLNKLNVELQMALEASNVELEQLHKAEATRKRFLFF